MRALRWLGWSGCCWVWVGGVGGSLYRWEVDAEVVVSDVEGLGCFCGGHWSGRVEFCSTVGCWSRLKDERKANASKLFLAPKRDVTSMRMSMPVIVIIVLGLEIFCWTLRVTIGISPSP